MPKIMIVDDDAALQEVLKGYLILMGYSVGGTADSGAGAVEMAREMKPDLILMDIVLPGEMDGISAAQKIKAESDVPIVFITGYGNPEYVEKAQELAPFGYLMKPFDKEELGAVIDIALHKKAMELKLKKANEQLAQANRDLEQEIKERTQAEAALEQVHNKLEQEVEERTAELSETNEQLKEEILDRKKAEEILKEREKDLEGKKIRLEELNAALKILLEKRDEAREELEERVMVNVKEMVLPYVAKLKSTGLDVTQETFTDIIESNLDAIISPFLKKLSSKYLNLTPTELRVADLVKQGLSTKEIGHLLNSSPETISRHRKSIRKKLQLKDKKSNLRTHLLSLQ